MRYGVIDFGSNTIRLCIFDIHEQSHKIKTILNRKSMAGLMSYVEDGCLTQEGIKTAISVLNKQLKRTQFFKPERVDIFATAILRNIKNSEQVHTQIEAAINRPISLLSGYDEAHLGFIGASHEDTVENGLLIDIGGGSTELTSIKDGKDYAWTSVAQGSLSSFEAFVSDVLPLSHECEAIKQAFLQNVSTAQIHGLEQVEMLYGIGGSVRAIASANHILYPACPDDVVTKNDIDKLKQCLNQNRKQFVRSVVHAAPERLHTISCGLCIVDALFEVTSAQVLQVCENGIREGYVLERMVG